MEVGPDEPPAGVLLEVLAGDLTGDGQDEIVLSRSSETVTAVWSIGPELQIEVLTEIRDRWLRDMADWDGDGDGDLDLVVLSHTSDGGYTADGVYVLKSLVSEQITAVQTPVVARPVQHRLGNSYPNPFNPRMVIPLDLATDQRKVRLALYDVLGRRVRQLWEGPLGAGSHRLCGLGVTRRARAWLPGCTSIRSRWTDR